jgi:hypothetical protein
MKQTQNVLELLDNRSHVGSKGNTVFKQPVRRFCYLKQVATANKMQCDPKIVTMMYVLRKDLELGWNKASQICQMFFRAGSVHPISGRFQYLRFEYGWKIESDNIVEKKPYGLVFPKLTCSKEADQIAMDYIQQHSPVQVSVLKATELVELGLNNFLDQNFAIVNVFEAVEMLVKFVVDKAWREFCWFSAVTEQEHHRDPITAFLLFKILLGFDCCPVYSGSFSRKSVTTISMTCANAPGLVHRPEFNIPIAVIQGAEHSELPKLAEVKYNLQNQDEVFSNVGLLMEENMPIPKPYFGHAIEEKLKMKASDFFKYFLLFDDDQPICHDCTNMFSMCVMLMSSVVDVHDLSAASRRAVRQVQISSKKQLVNLQLPRRKRAKTSKK